MVGCIGYGAEFDFPAEPPVPEFAEVVAQSDGSDDDDPMRGRAVVIEVGDHGLSDLLGFYREQFPAEAGWRAGAPDPDVGGGHELCLVNNGSSDYDEYLEVNEQSARPNRYWVSLSRLHVRPEWGERTVNRCGLARIWFP